MQGYGSQQYRPQGYRSRGHRPRQRPILVALIGLGTLLLPACSLLDIDAAPSRIVIPGTDAPITETPDSSLRPTSASRSTGVAGAERSPWSFERVIKAAPRASNSEYQIGATAESGERADVSGYHFSTEDRSIRCSTGNNGADALACVGLNIHATKRQPNEDSNKCDWKPDFAILDANGPKEGACANSYPVLFRSRILPAGSAITIDRFACLADNDDLYCIESTSGTGFAVTASGFRTISADQRAPDELLGMTPQSESSTREKNDSSPVAPTS